jgi:hypothetical protein
MWGLQPTKFLFSLFKAFPTTTTKLMGRAEKHMNVGDAMVSKKKLDKEERVSPRSRSERLS